MQKKIQKLLRIQLVMMLLLLVAGWAFSGQIDMVAGIMIGSFIAIATTIMAMLIFRRLPKVIPAKIFYSAMILNEVMKWLLVIILTVLFIRHVAPLGLIIGFLMTYLSYFWLILVD